MEGGGVIQVAIKCYTYMYMYMYISTTRTAPAGSAKSRPLKEGMALCMKYTMQVQSWYDSSWFH